MYINLSLFFFFHFNIYQYFHGKNSCKTMVGGGGGGGPKYLNSLNNSVVIHS